jgi:hypothetical protein
MQARQAGREAARADGDLPAREKPERGRVRLDRIGPIGKIPGRSGSDDLGDGGRISVAKEVPSRRVVLHGQEEMGSEPARQPLAVQHKGVGQGLGCAAPDGLEALLPSRSGGDWDGKE